MFDYSVDNTMLILGAAIIIIQILALYSQTVLGARPSFFFKRRHEDHQEVPVVSHYKTKEEIINYKKRKMYLRYV